MQCQSYLLCMCIPINRKAAIWSSSMFCIYMYIPVLLYFRITLPCLKAILSKSVDSDEEARYELPHLNLLCLPSIL